MNLSTTHLTTKIFSKKTIIMTYPILIKRNNPTVLILMQLTDTKRLRWACRRGMLELDLILLPFFEQHFAQLSIEQQTAFIELLSCTDQELYTWLLGYEIPSDATLQAIVENVRATHALKN